MTIKDYLQKVKSANLNETGFTDTMMEATEIWSNDACEGYFLRAAQLVGLNQDTIKNVLSAFNTAFEEVSIDDAADIYRKY